MVNTSPPNGNVGDKARQDSADIKDTARADWEEAKAHAREDLDAVKREAKHEFDHAREAAGEFAEGQKNSAAKQIEGLASAVDRFGNDMREGDQAWVGRYAEDVSHRLKDFAQHTRSSSVDDLMGDVERFGRERPAAFLAGAALLGLAASRFLSASAQRRTRDNRSRYYSTPATQNDLATPNVQPSRPRTDGGQL